MKKLGKKESGVLAAALVLGIGAAAAGIAALTGKLVKAEVKEKAAAAELEDLEDDDDFAVMSAEDAKALMDKEYGYKIVDVRTREEYAKGHVPGAVLLTDTEIPDRAEEVLPDKDQLIFVYCRSGRRSHAAAKELADMGYTNIRDMGGILSWPYAISR